MYQLQTKMIQKCNIYQKRDVYSMYVLFSYFVEYILCIVLKNVFIVIAISIHHDHHLCHHLSQIPPQLNALHCKYVK